MNFTDVKKSVMLTIAAGKTPLVISERGNGKTSMMMDIARQLKMKYINIDCNLLKEGEIGGLPIPSQNKQGIMTTEYAIHAKIKEIEDYLIENPDGSVLLFMDELNRCTREVMSELMNIILNKQINNYHVPDNVFIAAAMNPSQSTDGFVGNASYGVTEMDAASKDRLVWLYLDVDPKEWLGWATDRPEENRDGDDEIDFIAFDAANYDTNIENDIVEFIASNPNLLNTPAEERDVTSSPRSWQFASDIIRTYKANEKYFTKKHLDACIKGCVGDECYLAFSNFVANNKNPLIKPEEFWAGDKVRKELLDKFEIDLQPRQLIMAKNVARHVAEISRLSEKDVKKIISIYERLPIELLLVMLRYIRDQFNTTWNKLVKYEGFLDLYMEASKQAR